MDIECLINADIMLSNYDFIFFNNNNILDY